MQDTVEPTGAGCGWLARGPQEKALSPWVSSGQCPKEEEDPGFLRRGGLSLKEPAGEEEPAGAKPADLSAFHLICFLESVPWSPSHLLTHPKISIS